MIATLVGRWNWDVSAQWRAGSLASAWAFVLFGSFFGPLLVPLLVGRSIVSGGQLLLNTQLGRREPLERPSRIDWTLWALTLLASMGVAAFEGSAGQLHHWWFLLPVLAPFSAIQVRACQRSRRTSMRVAAWHALGRANGGIVRQPVPLPTPA